MTHRSTLTEIARRCGVHTSTVSRALADDPRGVGPATVERIRRVADEVGYSRNRAAAALKTGRSNVIGVLVPRLTDFVLARIYEGCESAAASRGFTTVVTSSDDSCVTRMDRVDRFLASQVDGLIICDSRFKDDEVVGRLEREGVPYVLANRRSSGQISVTLDDHRGGAAVGEHLCGLGHSQIGVVAGWDYASTCIDRVEGLLSVLHERGIVVPASQILHGGVDAETGFSATTELLERNGRISAIFAVNDFGAIGAMGAARAAGRSPGVDLSIVGFNDIPLAARLPIPLTSVRSNMSLMGSKAVELLLARMQGEMTTDQSGVIDPILIERESSRWSSAS